MNRPRITVFGLTCLIALLAVGLACLLHASAPWASVAVLAYFAALASAPIGIAYSRGPGRAFWAGFTAWVWIYLALTTIPLHHVPTPTAKVNTLIGWAYRLMIPPERQPGAAARLLQPVKIPNALIQSGESYGDLTRLDVRSGDELLAEGVGVQDSGLVSGSGFAGGPGDPQSTARFVVQADPGQVERLTDALAANRQLTVSRHQPRPPSPLAQLVADPPVDEVAFLHVGNALIGIAAGVVGGLIGRWFYGRREQAELQANPSSLS